MFSFHHPFCHFRVPCHLFVVFLLVLVRVNSDILPYLPYERVSVCLRFFVFMTRLVGACIL